MTTAGQPPPKVRHLLDALHDRQLNFDLDRREEFTQANGWNVDAYCRALPPEPPGPPLQDGSWMVAREVLRDYEFADPRIIRAVYHHGDPFENREMLLEARFYGLTFHLGVRVGGVNDEVRDADGQRVRVWGWNYRTLQGHMEMGQMDYEIWKWLDTGTVQFRIEAFSKRAHIPNPLYRLGFVVFGRWMQRRFAAAALDRMERIVTERLLADATGRPPPAAEPSVDEIQVHQEG